MKYILGIDVGGSKIAAGLVDKTFHIHKPVVLLTSKTDLMGQIIKLIQSYEGFDGIGLALPGRIMPDGTVPKLPNIPLFKAYNIREILSRKFKVKVNIINDAKAFTLAEALLGSGRGYETVVGITLGTGIGSGLVRNGKIYYGRSLVAGEIGEIMISDQLTLEGLMRKSGEFKTPQKAEPTIKMVLSLMIRTLDPDVVVIGGGRSDHPWMQKTISRCLKSVFDYPIKTIVKASKLKHAGIIGATLSLLKK